MATAHRTFLIALALAASSTALAQGTEFAVVEGMVINAQNSRTIPRASVNLVGMEGAGSRSTRADGGGHFIFQHVEPGHYKLAAERQGFFSDEQKREYQPVFQVAAGEHVKNMPVRLMPTAVISGEIVDEYDEVLQNVEVKLLAARTRMGQMYLTWAGRAMTDDLGRYRISGLRPGKYYLMAEYKPNQRLVEQITAQLVENTLARIQPGSSSHLTIESPEVSPEPAFTYPPLFYPGSGDFHQAQALKLNPGDEMGANFLFISSPVVAIKGRVTNGMTGAPATGAKVTAYWTDYVEGEGLPAQISPSDGTFVIRGLAPGFYKLRATFTEDGQVYEGEQAVEVGEQGAENVEISPLPDFAVAGHVTLVSDGRTTASRVVVDFAGEGPMRRVDVSATTPEFKFEAQLRPEKRYHVNVLNLPEDCYLKSLLLSGHEAPPDYLVVNGRRGELELVVSPFGGRIEGTLLDATDKPNRGSVLLAPDGNDPGPPELFRRARADSQGKFTFRGVPPGSYRLLGWESLDLLDEVNESGFSAKVAGRRDLITVEERGRYTVSVKLSQQ